MNSLPSPSEEEPQLPDLQLHHAQKGSPFQKRLKELLSLREVLLVSLLQAHQSRDQRQIEQRRREVKRVTKLIKEHKRLIYLEPYQRRADIAFAQEKSIKSRSQPLTTRQMASWVKSLIKELLKKKEKKAE